MRARLTTTLSSSPPPTPPRVRHVLAPCVEAVLISVCSRHGADPIAVANGSRVPGDVRARREWIRLVQNTWALSSPETARLLNVDHTTVLLAQKVACSVSANEASA